MKWPRWARGLLRNEEKISKTLILAFEVIYAFIFCYTIFQFIAHSVIITNKYWFKIVQTHIYLSISCRFSSSRLSQRNRPQEQPPQRQICMDCKEMILQVVRAQSTARRLQLAKSLFQQQILANKT